MTRPISRLLVLASTILTVTATAATVAHADDVRPESLAWYEGRLIDLSESWHGAQACLITEPDNICFRTEAELRAYLDRREALSRTSGAFGILATCSTTLQLWDGEYKSGQSVTLDQRGITINLATWSFNNRAASYRIGACNSVFRNGSSVYTGNTSAGASANSMGSWNDTIDTVYIA